MLKRNQDYKSIIFFFGLDQKNQIINVKMCKGPGYTFFDASLSIKLSLIDSCTLCTSVYCLF